MNEPEKLTEVEREDMEIVMASVLLTPMLAKYIGGTKKDALLLRFIAMAIEGGAIGIENVRKDLTLADIFQQIRMEQQMGMEWQKKELANA